METQRGDIFNEWASKSELEKHVARFYPGAPRSAIAALEVVYRIGEMLRRPLDLYYTVKLTLACRHPFRWKVCWNQMREILAKGGK